MRKPAKAKRQRSPATLAMPEELIDYLRQERDEDARLNDYPKDGNLRMEELIAEILWHERFNETVDKTNKYRNWTPLDRALFRASQDDVDELRKLATEKFSDERIGLFVNYPKGKRGQKLRRVLLGAIGESKDLTEVEEAVRCERRIQQLFKTDFPPQWRKEHGVTLTPARLAARFMARDGKLVVAKPDQKKADWLEQAIVNQRHKKPSKRRTARK